MFLVFRQKHYYCHQYLRIARVTAVCLVPYRHQDISHDLEMSSAETKAIFFARKINAINQHWRVMNNSFLTVVPVFTGQASALYISSAFIKESFCIFFAVCFLRQDSSLWERNCYWFFDPREKNDGHVFLSSGNIFDILIFFITFFSKIYFDSRRYFSLVHCRPQKIFQFWENILDPRKYSRP